MHCSTTGFCKPFNQETVHVLKCAGDNCPCIHFPLLSYLIVEEVGETDPFQILTRLLCLYTSYSGLLSTQQASVQLHCAV